MSEGFVIMQIGNADLDHVCDQVFFPALKATGLEPRRVDRHNTGDLLKSEIVAFLERAEIIVADLTNERPNCYLEVGYAMGLGKKKNLILTVRADHSPTHPNHQRGGPRIHFDLQGYDLLFWDPDKLDEFRAELEKRIRRRLAIVHPSQVATAPAGELQPTFDKEWLDENRVKAQAGLASVGLTGFWEAVAAISPKGTWSQQELLQAENAAQVHTFGWPIGVVIQQDPYRPRPTAGGVVAELAYEPEDSRYSYDYWDVQRTGDFYTLRSLFEDTRSKVPVIYYNTRIVQATELLLFLARLYARLNVSETTSVKVQVT